MSTTTDRLFATLTIATAPEASRLALERIQKSLGFIPNLMAVFADNPIVVEGCFRARRYVAKYRINPAIGQGIANCVCRCCR
jgi:hypothetical protein